MSEEPQNGIFRPDWVYNEEEVPTYQNFLNDWREFVRLVGAAKASKYMKEAHADWPPQVVALDLSSKCNLKCPICRYHGDDPAEELYAGRSSEVDEFVQFIQSAGGAKTIAFGVMAEPFLHKNIWEALDRLRPLCQDFSFSTNALPLTEQKIAKLADYPVKIIHVSCDAGDEDGYRKWRSGGRFDQFIEKLELLVKQFGEKINFHSVVFAQNRESLLKAPALLKELGVSILEMASLFETVVSRRNGLRRLEGQELRDFLVEMLNECERCGIRFSYGNHLLKPEDAEWLHAETGGKLGCDSHVLKIGKGVCQMPWSYLGFEPDGPVSPCCGGGVEGFHTNKNPYDMPAEMLFNSTSILILRAMKLAGYTPRVCRENCFKHYDFTG